MAAGPFLCKAGKMHHTYTDAILNRLLSLHPKAIDLSTARIHKLLAKLGNPHHRLPPVVHLAGTNGKGSTLAFLRALCEQAGLAVHTYTSPHLVAFNERIRLAGKLIDYDALASLLEEVEAVNAGEPITFFEITTAAAFVAFSRSPADILLLETGLGGKLDATNVIDAPAACILTPVSHDHAQFLGTDIGKIALEKAHIFKAHVPAIIAPQSPLVAQVACDYAANVGAPAVLAGRDWRFSMQDGGSFSFDCKGCSFGRLNNPALVGSHQVTNAATALACYFALCDRGGVVEPLDENAINKALQSCRWPARLQHLDTGRLKKLLPEGSKLYLDGGHNPAAGEVLANAGLVKNGPPTDWILGMLNTKDVAGYITPLVPFIRKLVTVPIAGVEAGHSAEELAEIAEKLGVTATPAENITTALEMLANKQPQQIIIAGSLYLAGQVLSANGTLPE